MSQTGGPDGQTPIPIPIPSKDSTETNSLEEQWQGEEYGFEVVNNDNHVFGNDATMTSADNLDEKLAALTKRWARTNFQGVAESCKMIRNWSLEGKDIGYSMVDWLSDNTEGKLVDEAMDIMEGIEERWKQDRIREEYKEMLIDVVEIMTAIALAWETETDDIHPASHVEESSIQLEETSIHEEEWNPDQSANLSSSTQLEEQEPVRLSRAESMRRSRQERAKLQERRKTRILRQIPEEEQDHIVKAVKKKASMNKSKVVLRASRVRNGLVHDMANPVSIIGSDVDALYPSLEARQVADIVYQAVMESKITFEGISYKEGAWYIALTSSAQKCRLGPLWRVLPTRSKNKGVRPGDTGTGPTRAVAGEEVQWSFPNIELTDREKRLIVAKVMHTAVLTLFRTHTYNFGGKFYLQQQGGPIGLRSTCCIARIVMLWWGRQLTEVMANSNLSAEQKVRYMDDIRV